MIRFKNLLSCLVICLTISACHHSPVQEHDNSIYYWRTTFSLSDAERDFLRNHDVRKIYLRYFDVDYKYDDSYLESVTPQATIRFNDSVPDNIEIVPTVYITIDAIKQMQQKEDEYAEKIMKRVNAISRRNKIKFSEIQLDCDWTKRTGESFFRLCSEIKQRLDSTQVISSTIRLHQLSQDPPPVDKGVLMVYNTGNLMELNNGNSIFSQKDIEPYLKDNPLANYQLPLDVAYPTYGWSIVFYPGIDKYKFLRLVRSTDFSSFKELEEVTPNLYKVNSAVNLSDDEECPDMVYPDYVIKVERPDADEIISVKKMIDKQLKGKSHTNILYHLDENQLNFYPDNEISEIYSRN